MYLPCLLACVLAFVCLPVCLPSGPQKHNQYLPACLPACLPAYREIQGARASWPSSLKTTDLHTPQTRLQTTDCLPSPPRTTSYCCWSAWAVCACL